MKEKTFFMDTLYHGNKAASKDGTPHSGDNYRYKRIWGLYPFKGTHPEVMKKRIQEKKWFWDLKKSPLEWEVADAKKIVLDTIERVSGVRLFEYRSYKKIG
jgi:hypothetical protein